MSDDLIRRSDAINHCETWRDRAKEAKDKEGWWMADNLLKLMKDTPTAEPKRGEWVEVDDVSISCRCSVCGWEAHLYEDDVYGMPYCPNCGADMREREGE